MEVLFIVLNNETGETLERDWYPVGSFKGGTERSYKGHDYVVSHRVADDAETVRVFLEEVYD